MPPHESKSIRADHSQVVEQIPRLRRYARALTRNRDLADDLVQDCLERALERFEQWRPGTNLRAWLFTIMHNLYVSGGRRARAAPDLVALNESSGTPTPATQEASASLDEVAAALEHLSDDQREVLLLVGLEQLTYEEAARALGVPLGTVMSRLSRARERLRQLLDGRKPVKLRRVK
jgi:RNA polymerase sigma-70 factor (ECF subfamily)